MKKVIYVLILSLVVVSGLVFANLKINTDSSKKLTPKPNTKAESPKPITAAERNAAMKEWEATPEGIKYKNWEASPEGEKVLAGAAKISKHTSAFTNMEAVVRSLSLPPGSKLGFGLMARIDGVDYIVRFDPEKSQLEPLQSLKVNDKIIIKSHGVSMAPKYSYPIITCDYVELDSKIIFKRVPRKGGC